MVPLDIEAPSPAIERRRAPLRRLAAGPLAGPLILFAICCCFCWKLVLAAGYTWIDDPDSVRMDVPRLAFQWTTWHHHPFPLWDPHLWCGQPFLGEIVGAAFPLNWPFFLLPLPDTGQPSFLQLNWYFFILHFLGALFAYWLCRELGTSRWAAILGGFAFAFGGFFGLTRWPEVLSGLLLAPLVLLFLIRALRGYRPVSSAALCGMFLGLSWLSGHHEVPVYVSFTVAAIWVWQLLTHRIEWRRTVQLAGIAFLFTALVSAFQTLPGYEYSRLAVRWVGIDHPVSWDESIPYRVHAGAALAPSSLPAMILPFLGSDPALFTGLVLLVLAVIAVFCRWGDRWVRLFACIALAGLLLAFGGWDILHGVLYAVLPLFAKARNPDRLLCLFDLGIAILAAFGLDWLRSGAQSVSLRLVRRTTTALAILLFGIGIALRSVDKSAGGNALFMTALIALLVSAALVAREYRSLTCTSISVVVIMLVFIELGNVSPAIYSEQQPVPGKQSFLPDLTQYADIAEFLREQPGPIRVDTMKATGSFNFGDWYGIDTLYGFGAGVTSDILSLEWPAPRTQDLLAVGYSVSKDPPRPDQRLVFESHSGFKVYRNTNAFPRAWLVHQTRQMPTALALRYLVSDPSFDGHATALFEGSTPALQSCNGNDQAKVVKRTGNSVVIDAQAACRGMLVLADTFYPGWVATVDDRSARIWPAYNALRGVIVGPGSHRVVFRYRPASAIVGGILSLLGVFGACFLALRDRLT